MTTRTTAIVYWDHRDNIDVRQLNAALKGVYDGVRAPSCVMVPDTQSDVMAMVVSAKPMTVRAAQRFYNEFMREMEES